jgi:hypothetical protein
MLLSLTNSEKSELHLSFSNIKYSAPLKTTYLLGTDIGSLGARATSPIATPFLTPMVAEYVKVNGNSEKDNKDCPCCIACACTDVDRDITLAVGCGQSYQRTCFVKVWIHLKL